MHFNFVTFAPVRRTVWY